VEEAERLRKLKDERSRKENFELIQQRERDRAAKRAADAAARAAAAESAAAEPQAAVEAPETVAEEPTEKSTDETPASTETADATSTADDTAKPITHSSLELPTLDSTIDFDEPSPAAVEYVDAREIPPTPAAE
jgi:hypothetical protein